MAKRAVKKKGPTPEEEAKEFFDALDELEATRGIKKAYMLGKIEQALISAYKSANKHEMNKYGPRDNRDGREGREGRDNHEVKEDKNSNITVLFDEQNYRIRMVARMEVVEYVDNPETEIALEDVQAKLPNARLGDMIKREIKIKNFGRVAAQAARQVIVQGIREAERDMIYETFSKKTKEMLIGTVTRIDPRNGNLFVRIGSGRDATDALLPKDEQVAGEVYKEGDPIKVYVREIRVTNRGPQVLISRTINGLVFRLFEKEVPEIFDGTVEIKAIAREAGSRTKMAVWTKDPAIDPIGTCVGKQGARVNAVVEELHGEKVDIIKYSEDIKEFIAAALAPASVVSVTEVGEKSYRVVVPDDQLSLAIGKEGQNSRLAHRLTGCAIDIKSVTGAAQDAAAEAEKAAAEAAAAAEAEDDVEVTEVEESEEAVETVDVTEELPAEDAVPQQDEPILTDED